ncbi:chemotaxis protein CheB [Sorangium sp. So ce542]|uniref:chemotaxis protein CheB n=1 Tax=Sorangium sp. So ce542 TaxID=3133316 RepID=UPI003F62DBC6
MTTRVVIADDSDIAAGLLEAILEEDAGIRVVGRARTGAELLALPAVAIADVVLVDLLMPELDGLSVIRAIAARAGVIVVSSLPRGSAAVREALAQGAVDGLEKRDLAGAPARARLRAAVLRAARRPVAARGGRVILVAGSTGAIPALEALARGLGPLEVPVLVVQHLPDRRERDLARALRALGARARPARAGDALSPELLLAPSGSHMAIDGRGRIQLTGDGPVGGHRPSAEVLFASAAPLARRVAALVLSGLGSDGARALPALVDGGGLGFAQDPSECSAPGMPRAALLASPRVRPIRVADFVELARRWVLGEG